MSKEYCICLDEDKCYYPGDVVKGYILLDLKKDADIQYISLHLKGTVETQGENFIVIDKIQKLALPVQGKYTEFKVKNQYRFGFEFDLPKSNSLPSTAKIPGVANISYHLSANPKKPSFNFSHSLPNITKEVKFFDMINVDSLEYQQTVIMNNDLGFIKGTKSSQWNLTLAKSAFIRGERIDLQCNFSNFPIMMKDKALKISLVRLSHRTTSAKILERKVLAHKVQSLQFTETLANQSLTVRFAVPDSTPVSVFPATGRILSISYVILAELKMKGVKSAIKLKDQYTQEIAIVIGTQTPVQNMVNQNTNRRTSQIHNNVPNMSSLSLSSHHSAHTSYPSTVSLPIQRTLVPIQRVQQPVHSRPPSLLERPLSPVQSFHGALCELDVKPLARLDENTEMSHATYANRKSYLTRTREPTTPTLSGYFDLKSNNARPSPSSPTMRYSQSHHTESPHTPSTQHHSPHTHSHPTPSPIDRSITPLPPVNMGYSSMAHSRHTMRGSFASERTPTHIRSITVSTPHEIGPDDIINRGPSSGKSMDQYNDDEKAISEDYERIHLERSISPLSRVPSLTRQDTVSTASSMGLIGMHHE